MDCPHCHSSSTIERQGRTVHGFRRFRCRECGRRFNERTGTALNRVQVPTDIMFLVVERTASPRRKQATAWFGGAELSGHGDPGERAGGNDSDAVASGPDRRPDPGGLGTPTPQSPYPLAQLGLGMIRSSL